VTSPHERPDADSATGLLGDVVFGITQLVKGELALVRAEVQGSVQDATNAIVKLAIAAVLGIVALNVLAAAAVSGLMVAGLSPVWACLGVGIVLLISALVIVRFAMPLLAAGNLVPKRSFASMHKDAEILKSMVTPHATSDLRA
jgi:Putative Actinobacterial Holin-X, holin superfamily III